MIHNRTELEVVELFVADLFSLSPRFAAVEFGFGRECYLLGGFGFLYLLQEGQVLVRRVLLNKNVLGGKQPQQALWNPSEDECRPFYCRAGLKNLKQSKIEESTVTLNNKVALL
ncbi:conserved hypothetical protein [Theileria orientalis strain Shintoku]|uniref:Uncharacterized protein n=1 Tax=Theileria orientalis strain Shintoku TaxID=869250 RepID=J4D8N5_THEOR|nr:conserved hypothetical protein [Theileria orientalis strain Shintoku]BAM40885.1 conserved hypothetical protein [Theileria orientalis strain Shintoku]|eukprot:XP_009691186.1 conserved hypothetical protein [Theileria orientalis strain Shintoku]